MDDEGYTTVYDGLGTWLIADRYGRERPGPRFREYAAAREYADQLNDGVIARRFGLSDSVMGGQIPRRLVRGQGGSQGGMHDAQRAPSVAVGASPRSSKRPKPRPRPAARPSPVAIPYDDALAQLKLF